MTDEFGLIERIRRGAGHGGAGVVLGIGDDAALLAVPEDCELAVTTDVLNEGVHFSAGVSPADLGHKALAVNLSDLAAMGAAPRWALLTLSLPALADAWLDEFIEGFLALGRRHGVSLVGGDSCGASSLSVGVVAMGSVEAGRALRRDGARPGDLVVVSGTLGGAAWALEACRAEGDSPAIADKLLRPEPRVGLGSALVGKATSCIDISDGLLADLGHVSRASGCAAVVELAALPGEPEVLACRDRQRWKLQLAGGDDYELCFTWPAERREELQPLAAGAGLRLTVVGRMEEGAGVRCVMDDGRAYEPETTGYRHFS